MSTNDFGSIIVYNQQTGSNGLLFFFPVPRDTVYGFAYLLLMFVTSIIIENRKKLLIESVVRRAESTGAKCTPEEITEMLPGQQSDIESKSDDVLLLDLEEEGQGDEGC